MGKYLKCSLETVLADFEAGDFVRVEASCRTLLDIAPDNSDIYQLLGASLLKLDRIEEAIEALRYATELAPEDGEAFANLGTAFEFQGDFISAASAYCKALDLGETAAEIRYGAAVTSRFSGKPDVAVELIEAFAEEHKDNLEIWHLLAVCRMESGDVVGAATAFEHLLKTEQNDGSLLGNYAVVLAKLERRDEARAFFSRAVRKPNVDASCLLNYGMMHQEDGKKREALELYHRAANLDPKCPLICEAFAKLARRCNENTSVIHHLQTTLSKDPTLDFAWFYLAVSLLAIDEKEAGKNAMEKYLDLDPSDRLGGNLALGHSGAADIPRSSTAAYLKNFYRIRAQNWDQTVQDNYNGHDLIIESVEELITEVGSVEYLLDAGCGSGGLGVRLKPFTKRLDGIDISPEMLVIAEQKKVYDRLEVSDLLKFLSKKRMVYDLIVTAAVLFHFRDLDEVLKLMADALRSSGQIVFTVFKSSNGDVRLNEHNFFEHGWDAIEAAIRAAGLFVVSATEAIHEYSSDGEARECFCVRCHLG